MRNTQNETYSTVKMRFKEPFIKYIPTIKENFNKLPLRKDKVYESNTSSIMN